MTPEEIKKAQKIIAAIEKHGRHQWSAALDYAERDFFIAARKGWPKALDEVERQRIFLSQAWACVDDLRMENSKLRDEMEQLQPGQIPEMEDLRVWQQNQDDHLELIKLRAEVEWLKDGYKQDKEYQSLRAIAEAAEKFLVILHGEVGCVTDEDELRGALKAWKEDK